VQIKKWQAREQTIGKNFSHLRCRSPVKRLTNPYSTVPSWSLLPVQLQILRCCHRFALHLPIQQLEHTKRPKTCCVTSDTPHKRSMDVRIRPKTNNVIESYAPEPGSPVNRARNIRRQQASKSSNQSISRTLQPGIKVLTPFLRMCVSMLGLCNSC
jgi:hypothetical protein